jgi:prophage regulatory protein
MNNSLPKLGGYHSAPLRPEADPCSVTNQSDSALSLNQRELVALLNNAQRPRRALRVSDLPDLTGDSRSQIYARLNTKCSAFDPSFPRPFYVGRSPRWWEHDVIAWLESHAAATTGQQ